MSNGLFEFNLHRENVDIKPAIQRQTLCPRRGFREQRVMKTEQGPLLELFLQRLLLYHLLGAGAGGHVKIRESGVENVLREDGKKMLTLGFLSESSSQRARRS